MLEVIIWTFYTFFPQSYIAQYWHVSSWSCLNLSRSLSKSFKKQYRCKHVNKITGVNKIAEYSMLVCQLPLVSTALHMTLLFSIYEYKYLCFFIYFSKNNSMKKNSLILIANVGFYFTILKWTCHTSPKQTVTKTSKSIPPMMSIKWVCFSLFPLWLFLSPQW